MTVHRDMPTLPGLSPPLSPLKLRESTAIREMGVAARRTLTDTIKDFIAYEDPAGNRSESGPLAYRNLTTIIYGIFNLNGKQREALEEGANFRDSCPPSWLTYICRAEFGASDVMREGMAQGALRSTIKAAIRVKCQFYAEQMRAEQSHSSAGDLLARVAAEEKNSPKKKSRAKEASA